jgi:(2Fe-2S) ferredoxin
MRLNEEAGFPCLKLETANCLSMCALAPNLVLYPADDVYNKLDESALRRMIDEKLVPFVEAEKG